MIKYIYPNIKCKSQLTILEKILEEVSVKHDIPIYLIKSNRRFQELVEARAEYAKRAYNQTRDYTSIAEHIGRDRTMIYHYVNEYQSIK